MSKPRPIKLGLMAVLALSGWSAPAHAQTCPFDAETDCLEPGFADTPCGQVAFAGDTIVAACSEVCAAVPIDLERCLDPSWPQTPCGILSSANPLGGLPACAGPCEENLPAITAEDCLDPNVLNSRCGQLQQPQWEKDLSDMAEAIAVKEVRERWRSDEELDVQASLYDALIL